MTGTDSATPAGGAEETVLQNGTVRPVGDCLDKVPEGAQRQEDRRDPGQLRPSTCVSEFFQ